MLVKMGIKGIKRGILTLCEYICYRQQKAWQT